MWVSLFSNYFQRDSEYFGLAEKEDVINVMVKNLNLGPFVSGQDQMVPPAA